MVIHALQLSGWKSPELVFDVCSSKGTYIRVLAEDIAKALGSCAHLIGLRRTRVGDFNLADSVAIEELESLALKDESLAQLDALLLPIDGSLGGFNKLELTPLQAEEIKQGRPLAIAELDVQHLTETELFRLYATDGKDQQYLLGMAKIEDLKLKSVRLFPGLFL